MRTHLPSARSGPARARAGAAVAVGVALLVGACGSSDSDSSSAASTTAATASTAAPSAATTETADTSGTAASTPAASPATAAATPTTGAGGGVSGTVFSTAAKTTLAAGTARVNSTSTTKTAKTTMTVKVSGVQDFAHSAADLDVTSGAGATAIRTLLVGKKIYVKVPGTSGKPWAVADASTFGNTSLDPAASLTYLDAAVSNVQKVGTVQLAGTATTEYTATLDPIKALGPAASGAGGTALRNAGVSRATVKVYLDEQGRYRRLVNELTAAKFPVAAGATGPATVTSTQDYTDYGVAVHITAPPASQVGTLGG